MHQNDKRILRIKGLPSKTGFQPSTIYELISQGKSPAPFKLVPVGRAAGWFESNVNEWLADQAKDHEVPNSE